VTYQCGGCGKTYTRNVNNEQPNIPVGAVCSHCSMLVGICSVSYNTEGNMVPRYPYEEEPETSDREAAAALGIDLQPTQGGAHASEDDNDVHWN
jgi:DNA-directed RNA polymerase subunit RPC12/RpoP